MPMRPASASLTIYDDALASGWNDWSWDPITRNLANSSPVHAGSASIAVTYTSGWSGLKLDYPAGISGATYDTLRFWVNGGSSGGRQITVQLEGTGDSGDTIVIAPTANTWTMLDVLLSQVGGPSSLTAVDWFNGTPGSQPTFYLDDISLINTGAPNRHR